MNVNTFLKVTFSILLAIPITTNASAATITYNPNLGTLPTDQGFLLYEDGTHPDPYVTDGRLHQGPTERISYQSWRSEAVSFDFTQGMIALNATLEVISSNYEDGSDPNCGMRRAGYAITLIDSSRRVFTIWIAIDRIFIFNTGSSGTEIAPFDSTGVHQYQFVVDGEVGSLFIDGDTEAFLTISIGSTEAVPETTPVAFGDGSRCGTSETWLDSFSFTTECDKDVDSYMDVECGGDDCDDEDPEVNPGTPEMNSAGNCDDGKDNDCDGFSDNLDVDCCFIGLVM